MTDRAVSEVLSFVLVFSVVVSVVGLVYVSGFAGLETARSAEQVDNAERAFDVLADNMADIHHHRAPSRKTEVKLADAQLQYSGTTTEFDVTVGGVTDDEGALRHFRAETTPIVYSAGSDTDVVYDGGAVVRRDGDYARVTRAPPIRTTDDGTLVVQYVQTNARERGVSGSRTVLVRGERTRSEILVTDEDSTESGDLTVTMNVTTASERVGAWESYLEGELGCSPENVEPLDDGRTRFTCETEASDLTVSVTSIDLELS
ncbi:DUF7289 family protein [Halomarina ordinaria]|uniref:Flagellin n=1 Tax=Halomarina ordinaria TaxID=3033939 RepID=A0ABD5UAA3_9EURY|nr:hypothetical protein [Halomarina sp. PSRA2]